MTKSPGLLLIASPKMQRTFAFERALHLARACGMSLRIIALDYIRALEILGIYDHSAFDVLRESYLRTHRQWLEEQAASERRLGLDCTVEVLWEDCSVNVINEHIVRSQSRVLIKDVHHDPVFARLFSTPFDWHLLRECVCPVLFVTEDRRPVPRKILTAVDLYRYEDEELQLNDALIDAAVNLSAQCGSEVHVLYSYDWSALYAANVTVLGVLPIETGFHEALGEAHAEALVALCERHHIPNDRRHFMTGTPQHVIEAFVRANDIDLLMMGSLSRHRFDRILGNTAESLLLHAPCSLLIIRADTDATVIRQLFSGSGVTAVGGLPIAQPDALQGGAKCPKLNV